MNSRSRFIGQDEQGILIRTPIRGHYDLAEHISRASRAAPGYQSWSAQDEGFRVKSEPHYETSRQDIESIVAALNRYVEVHPQKLGGIPVVTGTRVPVCQLLAEVADGHSLPEIADDLDLDLANLQGILRGLAVVLNRPASR